MMIPSILHGDSPNRVHVRIPAGIVPDGGCLVMEYQGVRRVFDAIPAGGDLPIEFTPAEMSGMRIGTFQATVRVVTLDGCVRTIPSDDIRIKVTDCPGEAYGGTVEIPETGWMPDDATDMDSLADLKAKFNALKRAVTASCIAAAAALFGSGIEPGTTLNDIPGTATVGEIVGSTVPDWAKQPNPPKTGAVDSVNGKTGTVSLAAADVGALSTEGGTVKGTIVMYTDYAPAIMQIGAGGYGGVLEVFSGAGQPASISKDGREVATDDQVSAVGARVDALGTTVNAWQTYWDGDDVRLTVTNYYGSLDIPSLYLEQKMPAGDGHDEPWFRVVWDERTRWNTFMPAFTDVTNEVYQNKADRAWGVYDSTSGSYSPDGLLQISQEQVQIASGMAYQKTVTAGGCAVWVLKATDPTALSGELENGYFRITDGDGNALFEIVKGDKRVVGAVATDVQVSGGAMTVRYNSVSDEHPTMEVCTDLMTHDWQTEGSCTVARVTWGGSSGAWVATVTPIGARSQLFAKATFEAGGNTYIKNHVASSLDKVVVGGHEYTVTVEEINGKKLLVLR